MLRPRIVVLLFVFSVGICASIGAAVSKEKRLVLEQSELDTMRRQYEQMIEEREIEIEQLQQKLYRTRLMKNCV